MKIFFSWSGERSREVAAIFNEWLPEAIQAVQPFFSPEITKGTPWFNEITTQLESFSFGILFVTRENLGSPWMMFEAGALYKHFGVAKVCPLLFDGLSPADLQGALPNLNVTNFANAVDFMRLLKTINNALETPLRDDVLQKTFDRIHPELVKRVNEALKTNQPPQVEKSPERQLLEKILSEVQGGFAQGKQQIGSKSTILVNVAEENFELKRANREQEQTLALVRAWPTVYQRIIDKAGLTAKFEGSKNTGDEDLQMVKVAEVFRDAFVNGVDKGRLFLQINEKVDLDQLSEAGLQIAAEVVGEIWNPPTSARRIYLDQMNTNGSGLAKSRHIYPNSRRESDRVQEQPESNRGETID